MGNRGIGSSKRVWAVAACIACGIFLAYRQITVVQPRQMALEQKRENQEHVNQKFSPITKQNSLKHLNYAPEEWFEQCQSDADKQVIIISTPH